MDLPSARPCCRCWGHSGALIPVEETGSNRAKETSEVTLGADLRAEGRGVGD